MRDVAADAVEHAPELGHLSRHPRELAVGGIENAVNNDEREGDEPEAIVVEQRAAHDADARADDRDGGRRQPQRSRRAREHHAERAEEVHIRQLFDFVGFEGEADRLRQAAAT